jgi:hypothetical protein
MLRCKTGGYSDISLTTMPEDAKQVLLFANKKPAQSAGF